MKKLQLKFDPCDRVSVIRVNKLMEEGSIKSITMTEGVFVFMRSTAIVEMNENNFDTNFKIYQAMLRVMCSKKVAVKIIKS